MESLTPLQNNGSKTYSLHLTNITTDDGGEYICLAQSVHQGQTVQAMESAWLRVMPGKEGFYFFTQFSQIIIMLALILMSLCECFRDCCLKTVDRETSETSQDVLEDLLEDTTEHLLLEPGNVLKLSCDLSSRPGMAVSGTKTDSGSRPRPGSR
ncbi:hypothetical protein WMY93_007381 [Mugilogobius chulae]|uniref:Ig-like domain-containing protein n=1 Tax=Mugilogobius chulae TaxID=88201 RepID=A0AAW0PEB6_9GOBI